MVIKKSKTDPSMYEKIIGETGCAVIILDPEGKIKFLNRSAKNIFGFEGNEIIGLNINGTIVSEDDTHFLDNLKTLTESVGIKNNIDFEYDNIDKQKNKIRILWNCSRVQKKENKLEDIICIGIAIAQEELHESLVPNEDREKIAVSERNRLARELHDTVSQNIYSTSLIAEILPKIWEKDPKEGLRRLEEIRQLARGALTEMRMLLLELRPSTFAEEDLESLVKQLSRSIRIRTGIPVKVKVKGKYILPLNERLALYRITQEVLNNIAKHSSATKANILLEYLPDRMSLIIEDNGCGFDSDSILPDNLGLEIMKERAKSIGGSIEIKSKPGMGTKILVSYKKLRDE